MLKSRKSSAYVDMQMAFKANAIIPALLTKCLFVSFQLYLVYLVKSTGYIMNWNQN